MENPSYWTTIHQKVSEALPDPDKVVCVLHEHGVETTADVVSAIMAEFKDSQMPGPSIASIIVTRIRGVV